MIIEINGQEHFNNELFGTNQLVLVDFWASWCEPCKEMLLNLTPVSEKYSNVKFLKVKVDDNRELARMFKIMSVPVILIFKDGELLEFSSGYKTENAIEEIIQKYI